MTTTLADDGHDLRMCGTVWAIGCGETVHRRHTAHTCMWDRRHRGSCTCRCGVTSTRERQ